MKLALISFDGLDPRVIHNRRDELPVFDSLLDESMHGEWNTPGHTIPSFTATLTGRQYDNCNFHWDEGKGDYQRHRQTGYDYLWDLCDSSMTLLNIPVLYPPEDIDDAMVCGFLTPDDLADSNLAKPNEVQEILNDIGYVHDVHADNTFEELGAEGMKKRLHDIMQLRVMASRKLINKYDSELFYGVWTSPDRWFHQCHKHDVDYMPLYREANDTLGKMLDFLPSDVPKVIFSDHGFAHYDADEGVHKGHMYKGFYAIKDAGVPNCRDDSASIFDLFPTVLNQLGYIIPDYCRGRILFHRQGQDEEVEQRLENLGYKE